MFVLMAVLSLGQVNPKPGVIPTLKQWQGGEGHFQLTKDTRIVVSTEDKEALMAAAKIVQQDIKEIAGLSLEIADAANPEVGDIFLDVFPISDEIGKEGYTYSIRTTAVIRARTATGVFYGTRSLMQMLLLDGEARLPKGRGNDYPDHEERGFMLDTGRKFFTKSFLDRYVKFMSWYKMNDFQLHLNDNSIALAEDWQNAYSGFRLVSKKHPGLTSKDGAYSYEQIQDLQDLADARSIIVTPEIDAPAHALALTQYMPETRHKDLRADHLDLSKPQTQQLINDIWEEFIPWFRAEAVHIGADEYSSDPKYHADYKKYINTTAAFIKARGKKVRMWGGLKVGGGAEGVDRDITVHLWYPGYHDPKDAVDEGYKLINTHDGYLYIVPFAGYYYQYLNTKFLYEKWLPNVFGNSGSFEYGSPAILGGMFCVWNDKTEWPYTEEDVHDLVLPAMPTVAEKLWAGPSEGNRAYADFEADFVKLGDGPGVEFDPPQIVERPGNLAFGKSATASHRPEGHFGAAQVTDGRAASRWFADSKAGPSITVDLGLSREIGRVKLRWAPSFEGRSYKVQLSSDGEGWKDLVTMRGPGRAVDDIVMASHRARYVRLVFDKTGNPGQVSLFEVEVYRS
jgi:hexosaminidase